jgi:hypothetical protein
MAALRKRKAAGKQLILDCGQALWTLRVLITKLGQRAIRMRNKCQRHMNSRSCCGSY